MINYLKYKLYNNFSGSLFYICTLIFNLFVTIQFFVLQNFFGGNAASGNCDLHYFFHAIPVISAIIIPVLKLNESSSSFDNSVPLNSQKKIFASFISIFIQFAIMILPLVFIPSCVNLFGDVEFGQFFAGFLVLLLYGGACIAFCLFFSELFTSNALCVFTSIITLSVLNAVNLLSVYTIKNPLLDIFIQILSFYRHFDAAEKGIIDTRDLLYFVLVSLFLLFVSVFVNNLKRGKKLSKAQKTNSVLLFICILFLFLDSTRYYARFDFTKSKKYSISKYSENLLKETEEELVISCYQSKSLFNYYPESKNIFDLLKEYSRKKNITLNFYNTDKAENASQLEKYGIFARQIPVVTENKTEYLSVYSAIVLEYKDMTEIIPFLVSPSTLEYDIDMRLLKLFSGKTTKVSILVGNGMNLENDYSYVEPWLNANYIFTDSINPNCSITDFQNKLENIDILAVFGSDKLSKEQCEKIANFIEKGKSVFFAVSPYNVDIENSWEITKPKNQNLLKTLEKLGFDFTENLLMDYSCVRILMQSFQEEEKSASEGVYNQQINYPMWISIMPQQECKQGITEFWPVEVVENEKTDVLFYTSPSSWTIEPDYESQNKLFENNPFLVKETKYEGIKKTRAAALALKNRKIIFIPDQYFVNSLMLGYSGGQTGDYRNLDFLVNQILKLDSKENLALLHENSSVSSLGFYKTYNNELFYSAKTRTVVCLFIFVPVLICGVGLLFNLNKRKFLQGKTL